MMNKGFFSALVALLVLSVALSIALGSPIYKNTQDIPTEARFLPQETYLWAALDQNIASYMNNLESSYASSACPVSGALSSDQLEGLHRNVDTKIQTFSQSLGMDCQLVAQPNSVASDTLFEYRYHCTFETMSISGQVLERYIFETVTGPPLHCDFRDAFFS